MRHADNQWVEKSVDPFFNRNWYHPSPRARADARREGSPRNAPAPAVPCPPVPYANHDAACGNAFRASLHPPRPLAVPLKDGSLVCAGRKNHRNARRGLRDHESAKASSPRARAADPMRRVPAQSAASKAGALLSQHAPRRPGVPCSSYAFTHQVATPPEATPAAPQTARRSSRGSHPVSAPPRSADRARLPGTRAPGRRDAPRQPPAAER